MGALFLSAAAAKSLSLSVEEERCWSSEAAARPARLAAPLLLPPTVEEDAFIASIILGRRRESFEARFVFTLADVEAQECDALLGVLGATK